MNSADRLTARRRHALSNARGCGTRLNEHRLTHPRLAALALARGGQPLVPFGGLNYHRFGVSE